jgi:mono/diheme cytochrome c family protein
MPLHRLTRRRVHLKVAVFAAASLQLTNAVFGGSPTAGVSHVRAKTVVSATKGLEITSVEGDSWLRHLGFPFVASNMGRAGRWGSAPSSDVERPPTAERPQDGFLISGSDLYRFNCRSCHKPDGAGVPPEINSLIGPVQATSAVMIRAQMKQRGIDLDAKTVDMLVSQARAALRTRLQNGGEKMPPFRYLAPEEVDSLLAYLEKLAGIPGAERKQVWLLESAARVGEHLVKGTCHICHEAIGPGLAVGVGTTQAIPSLASLPKDRTQSEMIQKVLQGLSKPTAMMTSDRGQMPIFNDLKSAEVAAVYTYLVCYPPRR